jgi:hypothetical protein
VVIQLLVSPKQLRTRWCLNLLPRELSGIVFLNCNFQNCSACSANCAKECIIYTQKTYVIGILSLTIFWYVSRKESLWQKLLILGLLRSVGKARNTFCLTNLKGQGKAIWLLKFSQPETTHPYNMMAKWLIFLLWESFFSLWFSENYLFRRPTLQTDFTHYLWIKSIANFGLSMVFKRNRWSLEI